MLQEVIELDRQAAVYENSHQYYKSATKAEEALGILNKALRICFYRYPQDSNCVRERLEKDFELRSEQLVTLCQQGAHKFNNATSFKLLQLAERICCPTGDYSYTKQSVHHALIMQSFASYFRRKKKLCAALHYIEKAIKIDAHHAVPVRQPVNHLLKGVLHAQLRQGDLAEAPYLECIQALREQRIARVDALDQDQQDLDVVHAAALHNLAIEMTRRGETQVAMDMMAEAAEICTYLSRDNEIGLKIEHSRRRLESQVSPKPQPPVDKTPRRSRRVRHLKSCTLQQYIETFPKYRLQAALENQPNVSRSGAAVVLPSPRLRKRQVAERVYGCRNIKDVSINPLRPSKTATTRPLQPEVPKEPQVRQVSPIIPNRTRRKTPSGPRRQTEQTVKAVARKKRFKSFGLKTKRQPRKPSLKSNVDLAQQICQAAIASALKQTAVSKWKASVDEFCQTTIQEALHRLKPCC